MEVNNKKGKEKELKKIQKDHETFSKVISRTLRQLGVDAKKAEEDFEVTYRNYLENKKQSTARTAELPNVDLNKTLRALDLSGYNLDDSFTSTQSNLEVQNQEEAMATIEDLVRQLAEMQLQQQQQPQQQRRDNQHNPGEVFKCCSSIIIRFDKDNITNFLESVKLALSLTPVEEDKLTVLEYAKQRIKGSICIETKKYELFEDLRADVLKFFKPKRTVTEVETLIGSLTQKQKETVDEYSKRAFALKVEYEQASQAERAAEGHKLDEVRISEMERKVSRAFLNGLKEYVLRFTHEKPSTLSEASSVALEAESVSSLRFRNKQLEDLERKKDDSKQSKNTKNFQKNEQPRNGKNNKTRSFNGDKPKGTPKCYECGEEGHIKPKCPKVNQDSQASTLQAKPEAKRDFNKEGAKPKNGSAGGASVSAKSLKISKLR